MFFWKISSYLTFLGSIHVIYFLEPHFSLPKSIPFLRYDQTPELCSIEARRCFFAESCRSFAPRIACQNLSRKARNGGSLTKLWADFSASRCDGGWWQGWWHGQGVRLFGKSMRRSGDHDGGGGWQGKQTNYADTSWWCFALVVNADCSGLAGGCFHHASYERLRERQGMILI